MSYAESKSNRFTQKSDRIGILYNNFWFAETGRNPESEKIPASYYDKQISENQDKVSLLKYECNELQEKLIREGDLMSIEKLNELKEKQEELQNEVSEAQEGLKDLYNYIPFGLAGNVLSLLAGQLKEEKAYKNLIQRMIRLKKNENEKIVTNEAEKCLENDTEDLNIDE